MKMKITFLNYLKIASNFVRCFQFTERRMAARDLCQKMSRQKYPSIKFEKKKKKNRFCIKVRKV